MDYFQALLYHDRDDVDCTNPETDSPDNWNRDIVGFNPITIFDLSQTDGERLPASRPRPTLATSTLPQGSALNCSN